MKHSQTGQINELHSARSQFGFGLVLLLLCVGVFVWQWPWIRDVQNGPRSLAEAELLSIPDGDADALPQGYIRFQAAKWKETGVAYVYKNTGETAYRFVLIRVGERWAIAVVPKSFNASLSGFVKRFDSWDGKGMTKFLGEIQAKFPNDKFAPFYFSASKDQSDEIWAFAALIGVFSLAGLALCADGLRKWSRTQATFNTSTNSESISAPNNDLAHDGDY